MESKMKPEPLNLEDLWDWFEKKFGKDAMNRYCGYETNELINEIKQRIKSACEFYLRYKNHPELLVVEHEELIDDMLKNKLIDYKHARKGLIVYDEKYNEWLFKYVFKNFIGDENDKS